MLTAPAPSAPRRAHAVRLLLALVLGLGAMAYAASPGAGDSSEGGIAATRDTQRLMSLGAEHSCAITDAGAIECWGDNSHGQLGTGDVTASTKPRLVSGITGAIEVGSGTEHTCALIHGGTVKCWGLNGSGQVGVGSDADQLTPVTVAISGVRHIAVGSVHSCAMKQDGSVWCWGQNGMGQLGDGNAGGTSKVPVPATGIDAASPAADITAGENHTCARMVSDSRLRCWGANAFGQLGDGTVDQHDTPVGVRKPGNPGAVMEGVLAVSAGGGHTCALLGGADWPDNPVYCWGQNSYGQLGKATAVVDGVMEPSKVPLRVQVDTAPANPLVDTDGPMVEARSLSAGQFHTCAVMDTRAVRCWGQNGHGQLGFDRNPLTQAWEDSRWANAVPGVVADAAVAGGFHSCSLDSGQVSCWGYDFFGQLGGHVPQVGTPTTVTGVRGAKRIALANDAACALVTDGITEATRPQCWGSNAHGRLGVGSVSPTSSTIPVPVDLDPANVPPGDDPIHQGREAATSLHGGNGSFCATPVGIPGERCWGLNGHAELGDGTTTSRATPIAPTHLAGATSYDLGGTLTGGVERGTTCKVAGGEARCWGYNGQGQVGDATTTDRSAPVAVLHDPDPDDDDNPLVAITGVTAVAVGGDHACAIVGGGQVRCWGSNMAGQLGNNTSDPQIGAVTVQSDTDPDEDAPLTGVTALVAGDSHTCAIRGTGEVRCWGDNSRGQLGTTGGGRDEADRIVRAQSPVPPFTAGDLTDATKIVSGDDHTCAMRSSDSVTCWGENADGQLGTGIGGFEALGQPSLLAPTTSGLPEPWIKDIGASRRNTCAVLLDRTVSCWGDNSQGQVGDGIGTHSIAPVAVGGGASVGQNHVPTPAAISVTTTPGAPVVIPVVLTGIDSDGDAVTLLSASDPPKGTSALTGPAQVTYTPDAGCHDDSFDYVVSDGTAQVAATITVTMNCAPVADADSATTVEDQPVDVDVLAGDTDEDGDTLTISAFPVAPAHGTVSEVGGKARYVPAPHYCGPDSFTYSVSDGHGHTAIAPVTVTVTCAADAPTAMPDGFNVDEDTPTLLDVLANDSDPDGGSVALLAVTAPSHGTAVKDGARVRYVPTADYCGSDSFTYSISDGALTATATVTVTVICKGDSPRAVPDTATTDEDTAVLVDVLANDTHPDGAVPLSLTGTLGAPAHGSAVVESGKVRYTPAADFCGTDSFTYVVTDGTLTATGSVSVTVVCTNDAPVAAPDVATTNEDVRVHVHVISNDSDVDGDVLHVGAISDPAHGTAVGAIDNAVAYTPDPNWCGTESFTYEAVDGEGGVTTGTVTVTVTCVDDAVQLAPVADVTVPWGTPVSVSLVATDVDSDPVTDPIQYAVSPMPSGATMTGATFGWTPAAGDVGSRLLTASASSGGKTATRPFRIIVTKRVAALAWTGPASGQVSDQSAVRAMLTDAGNPVQGRTISFALGAATTSASTDPAGTATSALQVTGALGSRFVTSTFAGDAAYLPASVTAPFTVTAEGLAVQVAGTPHVVTAGTSAPVTYTADLTEEQDGSYVGSLSSSTVEFRGLDGSPICTGAISATGPGKARATCSAAQPLGALPVVVTVTSSVHTPRADVGVVTVAQAGAGLASGAGRVAGDAFGFTAARPKKGAPTGRLVHVVLGAGQATVVDAATLASYTTTCSGGGATKVCTASIAGSGATARTVDLATGAVSGPVGASISVTALSSGRYGAVLGGPAAKTIAQTPITSGGIRVD